MAKRELSRTPALGLTTIEKQQCLQSRHRLGWGQFYVGLWGDSQIMQFHVETYRKPLMSLISSKKNLDELPLKIQRFRVRLMLYACTISIWQESGCSRCFVPLSFSMTTDSDESQIAEEVSEQASKSNHGKDSINGDQIGGD